VIDIVICTHGDADHARGLASFLDHWSLPLPANELRQSRHIGQFWLPGKWADVLPRLMTDPRGIIADLIRELDELRIDVAQDNEADDDRNRWRNSGLELIDTAKAIRDIAAQAIKYKVRIRWFDFNAFVKSGRPRGGVAKFLVPLNAVELAPAPKLSLNWLALLTAINEESLVFFAPPYLDRLGVVFCGDSPLGDGPGYRNSFLSVTPQPLLPVVATAPHHGSENNSIAYSHLNNWCRVMVWLKAVVRGLNRDRLSSI
jgi:hypothetical protein